MRTIHDHLPMRLPAFALVTAALAGGCGGAGTADKAGVAAKLEPVELVLADHDGSPDNSKAWAEAVARRSGGTIRVRIEAGWRGNEKDYEQSTIGDVRGGRFALASIATRAFDEVGVTSFQPLAAPLLIDSGELEQRVLRDGITRRALAGTGKLGLVGLAVLPAQLRRPVGITHVMAGPRDYRGESVYVREGKVARETFNALGAAPVHKGSDVWTESVDAAEVGLEPVAEAGEAARYFSGITANVVLWPHPSAIVMRRDAFDRLSPAQQRALRAAAGDVLAEAGRRASAEDAEAVKNLCRIGAKFVNATAAEIAALRAAVEPVYESIERGPGNAAAIARIRALKDGTGPAPLSCATPAPSTGAQAALEGTFRTRISREELATSPLVEDADQTSGDAYGEITLRLTGGHVRWTQRNAYYNTVRSGTYTTDGDAIQIAFDDRGETFSLRWSLYRGKLKFDREEAIGPTAFVIKPFTRVR